MRNAFIKELYNIAKADDRIVLLVGDLGFGVVEDFANDFPNRFFNMGISEQNMIGVATALAKEGFIPFCYSIAPFTLLRPYEFIKNGPVLHDVPVRIISVGGGFEYGDLGYTHYCLEDIAITRVMPNLQSYIPINSTNATAMLQSTYNINHPIYYRVGKNPKSNTDGIIINFDSSGVEILHHDGKLKTAVIAISSIVDQAYNALELSNKSFNLYALTQINPLPADKLRDILLNHDKVITVESHYINGGLGTVIAEVIAENQINTKLIRLAVNKEVDGFIGGQKFMEEKYNIDAKAILAAIGG